MRIEPNAELGYLATNMFYFVSRISNLVTYLCQCWKSPRLQRGVKLLVISSFIFITSGCEEEAEKIKVLEKELLALKSSFRDLKDRVQSESERTDNFTHRIETTEQQSSDAKEQAANAVLQQGERFKRVEKGMAQIAKAQQQRESLAYLKIGSQGHAPIRTGHGTFLVRLEDLEAIPGGGFRTHIQLGNTIGLTVQQFELKGDFGSNAPELKPGEQYELFSQRLDDWQKTLTPFQVTVDTELQPNNWTKTAFNLPRNSNGSPVELLRLSMSVKRAYLSEKKKLSEFAITSIDSKSALMLKSPYGSFLMTIDSAERQEGGMLIHARIGNPLGYTITRAELSGLFGGTPPTRTADESPQNFNLRFNLWNKNLKAFKVPIVTRLKPMLWTPVRFILAADESHLKHIRLKFDVQRVSLSQERIR
ncbi:MAG: hypothetical protein QM496_00700 [Verrucomicrobiota bacterium]